MEKFSSKLELKFQVPNLIESATLLVIGFFTLNRGHFADVSLNIMGFLMIFVGLYFLIVKSKTFHLVDDILIVRRPLTLVKATDVVFAIHEITEIAFRKVGRAGEHIIISSSSRNGSYSLNMSGEMKEDFIKHLLSAGVNVKREGI